MKSKLIAGNGQKVWAIVFETGEEAAQGLLDFARQQRLSASHFTAMGAFAEVNLGFFEIEKRDYKCIQIHEQLEVLSLIGDVSLSDAKPKIHAHVVLGKIDGTAWGGHLLKGIVRPTLEVILTELPAHLRRRYDEPTGLALIDPELS
jgi:predicted DNA-binding protein with PD1-like motif